MGKGGRKVQTKKKTWTATVAGILNLINGSLNLLGVFALAIVAIILSTTSNWYTAIALDLYPLTVGGLVGIVVTVAVFLLAVGTVSVLGGISALQRKRWGLALAGSVTPLLSIPILSIPAIIFTAMSKDEFE
jgi:hypothetical protein